MHLSLLTHSEDGSMVRTRSKALEAVMRKARVIQKVTPRKSLMLMVLHSITTTRRMQILTMAQARRHLLIVMEKRNRILTRRNRHGRPTLPKRLP